MTVSEKKVDGWISNLVGALCDPIIVFPGGGWENDIPENIKKQIPLERLIMNMVYTKEGKGVPVGDCEALVYMFPRTMTSPMGSKWTHIYKYYFTKAMEFMKVEVPPDLRVDMLSDYDMHQLDDLKRFIWDARVKARKERARGETKKMSSKSSNPSDKSSKELDIKAVQPSFF